MIEHEQFGGVNTRIDKGIFDPNIDVSKTIEVLDEVPNIEAPKNKGQKSALKEVLSKVSSQSPLRIYVGSCPDYSHENGLYTHKDIGEDVPLLSQVHIDNDVNLLKALESTNVPYEYVLMIADVEAIDEVFSQKFTQGDQQEFLRRCVSSSTATQALLEETKSQSNLKGKLRSSSFFTEFGYDDFMKLQDEYIVVLSEKYESDSSFRQRVTNDIAARMDMYQKMYSEVLPTLGFRDAQAFLVHRDIRTKAQYLTLGRSIAASTDTAIIINHPTKNLGLFNDRNKYLLSSDGNSPQRTLPLFEMKKKVY